MEITRELRTLAKFTSETMPVLSVYLTPNGVISTSVNASRPSWRDTYAQRRC